MDRTRGASRPRSGPVPSSSSQRRSTSRSQASSTSPGAAADHTGSPADHTPTSAPSHHTAVKAASQQYSPQVSRGRPRTLFGSPSSSPPVSQTSIASSLADHTSQPQHQDASSFHPQSNRPLSLSDSHSPSSATAIATSTPPLPLLTNSPPISPTMSSRPGSLRRRSRANDADHVVASSPIDTDEVSSSGGGGSGTVAVSKGGHSLRKRTRIDYNHMEHGDAAELLASSNSAVGSSNSNDPAASPLAVTSTRGRKRKLTQPDAAHADEAAGSPPAAGTAAKKIRIVNLNYYTGSANNAATPNAAVNTSNTTATPSSNSASTPHVTTATPGTPIASPHAASGSTASGSHGSASPAASADLAAEVAAQATPAPPRRGRPPSRRPQPEQLPPPPPAPALSAASSGFASSASQSHADAIVVQDTIEVGGSPPSSDSTEHESSSASTTPPIKPSGKTLAGKTLAGKTLAGKTLASNSGASKTLPNSATQSTRARSAAQSDAASTAVAPTPTRGRGRPPSSTTRRQSMLAAAAAADREPPTASLSSPGAAAARSSSPETVADGDADEATNGTSPKRPRRLMLRLPNDRNRSPPTVFPIETDADEERFSAYLASRALDAKAAASAMLPTPSDATPINGYSVKEDPSAIIQVAEAPEVAMADAATGETGPADKQTPPKSESRDTPLGLSALARIHSPTLSTSINAVDGTNEDAADAADVTLHSTSDSAGIDKKGKSEAAGGDTADKVDKAVTNGTANDGHGKKDDSTAKSQKNESNEPHERPKKPSFGDAVPSGESNMATDTSPTRIMTRRASTRIASAVAQKEQEAESNEVKPKTKSKKEAGGKQPSPWHHLTPFTTDVLFYPEQFEVPAATPNPETADQAETGTTVGDDYERARTGTPRVDADDDTASAAAPEESQSQEKSGDNKTDRVDSPAATPDVDSVMATPPEPAAATDFPASQNSASGAPTGVAHPSAPAEDAAATPPLAGKKPMWKKRFRFQKIRDPKEFVDVLKDHKDMSTEDLFACLAHINETMVAWQDEYKFLRGITDDEENAVRRRQQDVTFENRTTTAIKRGNIDTEVTERDFVVKGIRAPEHVSDVIKHYTKKQDKLMSQIYLFEYDARDSMVGRQDPVAQREGLQNTRLRNRPKQTLKAAEAEAADDISMGVGRRSRRQRKPTSSMDDDLSNSRDVSRSNTPVPVPPTNSGRGRRGRHAAVAHDDMDHSSDLPSNAPVEGTLTPKRGRRGRIPKSQLSESVAADDIVQDAPGHHRNMPPPKATPQQQQRIPGQQGRKRRRGRMSAAASAALAEELRVPPTSQSAMDQYGSASAQHRRGSVSGKRGGGTRINVVNKREGPNDHLGEIGTDSFYSHGRYAGLSQAGVAGTGDPNDSRPSTSSSNATMATADSNYSLRPKRRRRGFRAGAGADEFNDIDDDSVLDAGAVEEAPPKKRRRRRTTGGSASAGVATTPTYAKGTAAAAAAGSISSTPGSAPGSVHRKGPLSMQHASSNGPNPPRPHGPLDIAPAPMHPSMDGKAAPMGQHQYQHQHHHHQHHTHHHHQQQQQQYMNAGGNSASPSSINGAPAGRPALAPAPPASGRQRTTFKIKNYTPAPVVPSVGVQAFTQMMPSGNGNGGPGNRGIPGVNMGVRHHHASPPGGVSHGIGGPGGMGGPGMSAENGAGGDDGKDYRQMTKSEKMSHSMKTRWANGSMQAAVAKRKATLAAKKAAAQQAAQAAAVATATVGPPGVQVPGAGPPITGPAGPGVPPPHAMGGVPVDGPDRMMPPHGGRPEDEMMYVMGGRPEV